MLVPRGIAFDKITGKAVAVCPQIDYYDKQYEQKVIDLPTDHYDFIGDINPIGKTEHEIRNNVSRICQLS